MSATAALIRGGRGDHCHAVRPSTPRGCQVVPAYFAAPVHGSLTDIRRAFEEDASSVAALLAELGYVMMPAQVRGKLADLADETTDTVRLAVLDGNLIGCISLHASPLFHAEGKLGRITSVSENQRGRGVGGALLASAHAWFELAGCVKFEVTSGDARERAHHFYARYGYARDGQRLSRPTPLINR